MINFSFVSIVVSISSSIFLSPVSFAHTHLVSSQPVKNAVLRDSPTRVELIFSEDLETAMSKVEVKDANGEVVSQGKTKAGGQGNSRALEISLRPLKAQRSEYKVDWKAVSKDTHRMQGSFAFTVDPGAGIGSKK